MSEVHCNYIGGKWVESQSGETFPNMNAGTRSPCDRLLHGDAYDLPEICAVVQDVEVVARDMVRI